MEKPPAGLIKFFPLSTAHSKKPKSTFDPIISNLPNPITACNSYSVVY